MKRRLDHKALVLYALLVAAISGLLGQWAFPREVAGKPAVSERRLR